MDANGMRGKSATREMGADKPRENWPIATTNWFTSPKQTGMMMMVHSVSTLTVMQF